MEPAELAELIAARKAGAKIDDLAAQFGIHRATVINHLDRAGIHRRWPGKTLTAEQIQQAGELYASGQSLVAVGEQFNVDKRYLSRVLREAGFEIRGPGRQPRG